MTRRFELNLVVLLTEMMRCDASWINREHDNVGSCYAFCIYLEKSMREDATNGIAAVILQSR